MLKHSLNKNKADHKQNVVERSVRAEKTSRLQVEDTQQNVQFESWTLTYHHLIKSIFMSQKNNIHQFRQQMNRIREKAKPKKYTVQP